MSRRSDFPYEMFGNWLDQDAADRLLAGRAEPDDAPPGFDGVARLVSAMTGSPLGLELEDERIAVAAAVRLLDEAAPVPTHTRRWRMRSKLSRAKLAGMVIVGTMIGTTGMAAANVLPDPAQNVVSNALSHVGLTVPSATDTVDTTTVDTTTVDTTTIDPTTVDATTIDPTTVEHPAATGEKISQIATTTDTTGVAKGAEISTTASGGMSQAGMHPGSNTTTVGAESPDVGGTGTANNASGGADGTGSSTADEASGGLSDAGAGNAPAPPTP
jgi:hypothetical protein